MYNVEAIVDKKLNKRTKKPMYLIKWEGYDSAQNTWEPIEHLAYLSSMIQEFQSKKKTHDSTSGNVEHVIDRSESKENSAKKSNLSARKSSQSKRMGLKLIKKSKPESQKNSIKRKANETGKPRGRKSKQKLTNKAQQKNVNNQQHIDVDLDQSDSDKSVGEKQNSHSNQPQIQKIKASEKKQNQMEKSATKKEQKQQRKRGINDNEEKQEKIKNQISLLQSENAHQSQQKDILNKVKAQKNKQQQHSQQQGNNPEQQQQQPEKQEKQNKQINRNTENKQRKKRGRKRKSSAQKIKKQGEGQQGRKRKIITKEGNDKKVRRIRRKNKINEQLPFEVIYAPNRKTAQDSHEHLSQQNRNESVKGESIRSSNGSQWRSLREGYEANNSINGLRGRAPAEILGMRKIQDVLSFYVEIKNQREWKSHDYMLQYYPRELCGFYQRNLVFQ